MGYLGNLDKINTLEMFLTDKGKELMLKENGLGLYDLISRFSLDDADYDYRRTSNMWVDGFSPSPDGSLLPFGTTQGLTNHPSQNSTINNPCRSCDGTTCAPLSEDCWYDMPDVRGDRGNKIINCFSESGKTEGIISCTNIYAFYDVTSMLKTDADAAKIGLNNWHAGISASTPNYSGKLFHIAVVGERWVNTSWYPWNGKLDTWDWTPCGSGITNASSPFWDYCKPPYTPYNGNSSTFLGGVSGPTTTQPNGGLVPLYPEPVTGLYLQADLGNNSALYGLTTGDWTGFNVLPPNTIRGGLTPNGTGGRAEFWTTGCTLVNPRSLSYDYNPEPVDVIFDIGMTAYSETNIVFATTAFTGTIFSGYTPNDFSITTTVGIPPAGSSSTLLGDLPINLCEDNCCPDNDYNGPGLFGCQECSPFDNTITSGKIYKYVNKVQRWSNIVTGSTSYTAGTTDLILTQSTADCVKYREMDRNVLIVDVFDESGGGENQQIGGTSAGILPLGRKSYYNGTDGNASNLNYFTLGDMGGENSPNWGLLDYTGYHGKGGVGDPPTLTDNWGIYLPGNQIQARQQQPTEDWKYSQDLFLKTHGLYDNFQGFIYPVVPLSDPVGDTSSPKMVFPLHLYGALYGNVVPVSEFQDNPTVVARGGTLSACTITNDYDVLIPVTYDPSGVQVTTQNSDYNWEPFDSSTFTPADAINPIAPYTKGMRNFGWDFNPTVGCSSLPCNVGNILSGGTFQNDLNRFVTGSSSFVTTILTACTECQCLPAVFINKKGPIEVVDDGCPCPDGTISEECCDNNPGGGDPENPITQGICGPLPSRPTQGKNPNIIIDQSGQLNGTGKINNNDLYIPKSYMNFRSGKNDNDTGIGANLPPLKTTSNTHNYSSYYTVDFNINLQQYYEKNKLKWDVEFESTSRYGDHLIEEGDGSKFYWIISSGYKQSKSNPKETKACISPTTSTINLNKKNTQGVNIAYLRGYWGESVEENYKSLDTTYDINYDDPMVKYEFCVTMVYTYKSKLLKKTKRFNVTGNDYGYKLKVKA